MKSIQAVAGELGLDAADVIPWGRDTAKVSLAALDRRPATGRLILVSAMTPTAVGEGKTTTTIGLAQGLAAVGRRACAVLREPSRAHSRFPGHALTPTGVMAIRCKQFHLPDL